jgi:hypothetical protein
LPPSFGNKKEKDGQSRRRYADPDAAITSACKDFLTEVGITERSA